MTIRRGKFIVLEGTDGSGKATQLKLLKKRIELEKEIKAAIFDFPQYDKTFFGKLVGRLLSGEFGGIDEVSPYLASLTYAGDRWQASSEIKTALDRGKLVLSNRYVMSNAHQVAKVELGKRREFWNFLEELEYGVYNIPREDLNIFLHVPPEVGQSLILKKSKRNYLKDKKKDIHEADINHQEETSKVYLSMAKSHPDRIRLIDCTKDGRLMTIEQIHELVWSVVSKRIFNN